MLFLTGSYRLSKIDVTQNHHHHDRFQFLNYCITHNH